MSKKYISTEPSEDFSYYEKILRFLNHYYTNQFSIGIISMSLRIDEKVVQKKIDQLEKDHLVCHEEDKYKVTKYYVCSKMATFVVDTFLKYKKVNPDLKLRFLFKQN